MLTPAEIAMLESIVPIETDEDRQLLDDLVMSHNVGDDPWASSRPYWRTEPATEMQIEFLRKLGYDGPANLNKDAASRIIDIHILARDYLRQRKYMAERKLRAEMRERARAQALAKKHKAKLDRLNATPPRARVQQNTLLKWMYEFEILWNDILADGVITPDEAEYLKAWLNAHRTISILHTDFITAIDRASADGVITGEEANGLYSGAVATIESFGGKSTSA